MTDAEHKLLIWCGLMLVRGTPLTAAEADEIDQLIAEVRASRSILGDALAQIKRSIYK